MIKYLNPGIFLLFFLLWNCIENISILREPKKKENPGAVAFGLFIFESDDKISPDSIKLKLPDHHRTKFGRYVKENEISFYFESGNRELVKKDDKRKYWASKNFILKSNGEEVFYVISELEPDVEYFLHSVEYSYTVPFYHANGTVSYRTYYVTLPLSGEENRKLLKIKLIPKEIQYLGIYGIKEEILKEGSTFLKIGRTKQGKLFKGEEILSKYPGKNFNKHFFGEKNPDMGTGKLHFQETFLKNQLSGYWTNLIQNIRK